MNTAIDINLLPPEKRRRAQRSIVAEMTAGVGYETFTTVIAAVTAVLLAGHLVIQGVLFLQMARDAHLKKTAQAKAFEKERIDRILRALKEAEDKNKQLSSELQQHDISWAQVLQAVSESLPRGVWLERLVYKDDLLLLQGASVSKGNTPLTQVHVFTAAMKEHPVLQGVFRDLELGRIKTRQIRQTTVADFVIRAKRIAASAGDSETEAEP